MQKRNIILTASEAGSAPAAMRHDGAHQTLRMVSLSLAHRSG